jgi:Flp pilus assembly protein TadD
MTGKLKKRIKASQKRVFAGFWAAVLVTALLLPLAGLSGRRDEAPAGRRPAVIPQNLKDVDGLLRDSFVAIRTGKYEAAVWTADEVLRIEPANVTALELQGSAFFLMKDRRRAEAAWRRALEIEPGNAALRSLLRRI